MVGLQGCHLCPHEQRAFDGLSFRREDKGPGFDGVGAAVLKFLKLIAEGKKTHGRVCVCERGRLVGAVEGQIVAAFILQGDRKADGRALGKGGQVSTVLDEAGVSVR